MKINIIIMAFLMLGTVDYIEDAEAYVELVDARGEIVYAQFPLVIFPCDVTEGAVFYIEKVDGVTEIRCGEPPE